MFKFKFNFLYKLNIDRSLIIAITVVFVICWRSMVQKLKMQVNTSKLAAKFYCSIFMMSCLLVRVYDQMISINQ